MWRSTLCDSVSAAQYLLVLWESLDLCWLRGVVARSNNYLPGCTSPMEVMSPSFFWLSKIQKRRLPSHRIVCPGHCRRKRCTPPYCPVRETTGYAPKQCPGIPLSGVWKGRSGSATGYRTGNSPRTTCRRYTTRVLHRRLCSRNARTRWWCLNLRNSLHAHEPSFLRIARHICWG